MLNFVQSRYTITVPLKDNRALAYNAMSGGFALWEAEDTAIYNELAEGGIRDECDPTIKALAQGGYIVTADTDELAMIEREYNQHRYDPSTMILTIAPTLACNFGCDYCFQGQDKSAETMSQEVQDAIVALVERVAPKIKHLSIAWYGGEPLVRFKIIEALSDRFIALCDRYGIKYTAMIVTNGYKLTAEVARSLWVRRVGTVQITLDGSADYHDQRRVLLSGGGTFDKIIDNVRTWIDEVPISVSVRVNIDARNMSQIHGLIDHMADVGLSNKKNLKMYFAPIEAITEGCHNIAGVTMTKTDYGKLEAELYRHGFEAGMTSLPYPPRFRGTCSAVRPKGFTIVPNGDMHKCWDTVSWPDKRVGTVFNLDALNEDERVMAWLRWTPFDNATCRNCRILPVCTGACAYKFVHSFDTRGEAAVLPCPSWKYNMNERLLLRAEKMGIVTAEDYEPDAVETDPQALCADVYTDGGQALPETMQAMYEQLTQSAGPVVHIADIGVVQ